ncbi:MAG: TRAP transporter large permease subunit [Pseudomonadota bacterium]
MIAIVSTMVFLFIVLLGAGFWIGMALLAVGAGSLSLFRDSDVGAFLAGDMWRSLNAPELAALPLFILMGELLYRTKLADALFEGLRPWLSGLRGGLIHTNVVACTLFAAVSGSSAATTATVGRITLKQLESRGYSRDLALGSLCGAGTLGFLIPPSIILIIYGVLADTSIIDLFVAGIVPGLVLALSYMVYIAIAAGRQPGGSASWAERLKGLALLGPVFGLIAVVIGSMYAGIAGPTEAAAVGVFGALVITIIQRSASLSSLKDALMGTVRTCAMIGLIVAGAFFLSKVVAIFQLPQAAADMISGLGLSPIALIALLLVFYVALGMVMDGLSIIVMTLPIALPLVQNAGFDPVWFGIFIVIVVEMSQITPPVGFNLFIVQEMTGESIARIARASLPFFLIIAAFVAVMTLFPGLITWHL